MPVLPAARLVPNRRHLRRAFLGAALLVVLACAWKIGDTFLEDDNFRVVSASLFRSGQLRLDEWKESLHRHGYRSVLNLRGTKPREGWYQQELSFTVRLGLAHYDLSLSSDTEPTAESMEQLVALMRQAPKPLLVHCNHGADRTGLVAALYVYAVEGKGVETAEQQLSLWYGHFPWFGSPTAAMERAFASYVRAHPPTEADAARHLPAA